MNMPKHGNLEKKKYLPVYKENKTKQGIVLGQFQLVTYGFFLALPSQYRGVIKTFGITFILSQSWFDDS